MKKIPVQMFTRQNLQEHFIKWFEEKGKTQECCFYQIIWD